MKHLQYLLQALQCLEKERLCHWFVLMFAKARISLTAKKLAGLSMRRSSVWAHLKKTVSRSDADNFIFDPDYIGVHGTNDLVMIQITWNEGRNPEQKKAL
jgi:hypothetical protein